MLCYINILRLSYTISELLFFSFAIFSTIKVSTLSVDNNGLFKETNAIQIHPRLK